MGFRRKPYTEDEILEGCIGNNRKYQAALYSKYFPRMMGMCMRYTRDEDKAMDILNEGFLRVFRKIDKFSGKGSLEGWIRKIVYHSISDHFKKESKYLRFIVLDGYDDASPVQMEALDNLYYSDIVDMVELLPGRSKEIFKRFAIDGLTHKEIAEQLGISIGTSKWHLSEARARLKDILKSRMQHYHAG